MSVLKTMQGAWHQKGKQTVLCGKQLNTYEKFPPPRGGGNFLCDENLLKKDSPEGLPNRLFSWF